MKGKAVDVFRQNESHENGKKVLARGGLDKVFVGYHPGNESGKKKEVGNSILVKKGNKYVYIGESVKEFVTTDNIKKYVSPVGNSAVPYPFAVGDQYTYLMLEGKALPNTSLKGKKDPYEEYYFSKTAPGVKTFSMKTLVRR